MLSHVSDYHCWRKLGGRSEDLQDPALLRLTQVPDITTALFTLGLHQEPKSELPFFLAELHRNIFWIAYYSDKNLATFFGRPPMINGKFSLCRMPLDLEESQLALEGDALDRALSDLDHEGWNQNSTVGRASWLRVSVIFARLREEILELSLGGNIDDLDERARYYYSQSIKVGD